MRYVVVAFLFLTSTVALAQEGGGHGPPKSIIVMPQPTTPIADTVSVEAFSAQVRISVDVEIVAAAFFHANHWRPRLGPEAGSYALRLRFDFGMRVITASESRRAATG